MKIFLKNNWFGLLTVSLSISIMSITLITSGGIVNFINIIKTLRIGWLFAVAALVLSFWVIDGFVLNKLTRTEYDKYPFRKSFATGMIGLLYSALTPFAVGGQPMQIYEMSKTGVKSGDACSYITIKSIIYQACMLLFSIVALVYAGAYFIFRIDYFVFYVIFGIVCNATFIGIILLICINVQLTKKILFWAAKLLKKLRLIKNFEKSVQNGNNQIDVFYESIRFVRTKFKTLIFCIVLTIVQIGVYYFIPFCILLSFGVTEDMIPIISEGDLNIIAYMVFANAIITMITSFVPLPGAAGAAEGSFYLFFSIFFPSQFVLAAVIVWRFATYYACIIIGMLISLFSVIIKKNSRMQKNNQI